MSMQDTVADMLTRVRNAQMAKKATVSMPQSKLKQAVAKFCKHEGYLAGVEVGEQEGKPTLTLTLKYYRRQAGDRSRSSALAALVCVNIQAVKMNCHASSKAWASLIVSTNKGIMTDRAARAAGVGR
jgi:small subunit ribosomal protein S8